MTSKIKDPKLFEAVYRATARRLGDSSAPTVTLYPKQDGLVRSVKAQHLHNQYHAFDPGAVLGNLVVRDAAMDWNRFSGSGPGGKVAPKGGLYTSRHASPMMGEIWHYAPGKTPNVARALASRGVLRLRILRMLTLLDLSRYSPRTDAFLDALEGDSDVRAALAANPRYAASRLSRLLLADDDYTVGRAVGLAVAESPLVDGLKAGTARHSDRPGETGDNVVLFGPDGQPIRRMVEVDEVFLFRYDAKRKATEHERHPVAFDAARGVYYERN